MHVALPFAVELWPISQSEHIVALGLLLTLPRGQSEQLVRPSSLPN
jgi:hypothetical protein